MKGFVVALLILLSICFILNITDPFYMDSEVKAEKTEEQVAVMVEVLPLTSCTHTVQKGDTLWRLALRVECSTDELRVLNNIPADSDLIKIGQILLVPCR